MITLVAFAFAADSAVVRSPSALEKAEPKPPKGPMDEAAQKSFDKAHLRWALAVDALLRSDRVMQRELPMVAACWGATGDASFKLVVAESGVVSRVTGLKGGDAALQKCLDTTYKGQQFGAFTTSGDLELIWQVHLEPPSTAPAVSPLDRDLGIGASDFGSPVADLGSSLQVSSSDMDTTYQREMDQETHWFGVELDRASYLYLKSDALYAAVFEVKGDTGAFNLRTALKDRYGQPRWDPTVRAWYWRGNRALIVAHDLASEPGVVVTVFDHVRAKDEAGIQGLPGDQADAAQSTTRIPAILRR